MRFHKSIGLASAALLAIAANVGAQTTTAGVSSASGSDRQAALASVAANREGVIASIVERWRPEMNALTHARGWDVEIASFLRAVSAEKLLEASEASSYEGVVAAVHGKGWAGPNVVRLAPGDVPSPNLGGNTSELVFYPVTPCRIIDTRLATPATAIGPSAGRQFKVNLTDYSAQGGFAGSCGIPTTFDPAAVSVNVTSTQQTGLGFLAVVPTGAGIPNSSLLNYTPGVDLANSAVVRQAQGLSDDIFVFSGVGSSHVIVDVLGYFAAPTSTALDNNVLLTTTNIAASATFSIFSPACPAGWRLTGGGHVTTSFTGPTIIGSRPVQGTSQALITGVNVGDRWLVQGANGVTAQDIHSFSVCSRIPGN